MNLSFFALVNIVLAIFTVQILDGCTKTEVPVPTQTATSTATSTDVHTLPIRKSIHPWAYDDFVATHVTDAMLAANAGALCPNYSKVDHKAFWVAMVRATAYYESGYHVDQDYTESFPDTNGNKQISSGLLQLSLDDSKNYPTPSCKKMNTTAIIHTAEPNLACGIEIMDYRIKKYPGQAIGPKPVLGSYWSTIRDAKILPMLKADIPECFQ